MPNSASTPEPTRAGYRRGPLEPPVAPQPQPQPQRTGAGPAPATVVDEPQVDATRPGPRQAGDGQGQRDAGSSGGGARTTSGARPAAAVLAPTSAMPLVIPAEPPRRQVPWIPVLAVATVLALIAAAFFAARVSGAEQRYQTARALLATASGQRDMAASGAATAQSQLERVRSDASRAAAESDRRMKVVSTCLRLVTQAGVAADKGDRAGYAKIMKSAAPVCTEAHRYTR
jgi:hypothetical protein